MKIKLATGERIMIETPDTLIDVETGSSYIQERNTSDTYTTVETIVRFPLEKDLSVQPHNPNSIIPDKDCMRLLVRRRSLTPKAQKITPPTEGQRIKHIVSELVRISKKDRDESRNLSERSKNRAILEGMANALDAMAMMIQSGELFTNMPAKEGKENA